MNSQTVLFVCTLKVTYHPLCSMNKFMTNKSKLPQGGAQLFPYKYGVIGYHVTHVRALM